MILEPSSENIEKVAQALKAGEVAAMPTETVYGLAGNALDPKALSKIFQAKDRPTFDPLIVHVSESYLKAGLQGLSDAGLVDLSQLQSEAQAIANKLIETFWPGPLTLVLPKLAGVPDLATAGIPSVAVRMPRHPVAQALLRASGLPLAAPSANRFGRISPTRAEHVEEELGDRISWILDGGACVIGLESTVVAIKGNGMVSLLRPGGISQQDLAKTLGRPIGMGVSGERQGAAIAQGTQAAPAPGMLESHYAPRKPLILLAESLANATRSQSLADELSRLQTRKESKLGILIQSGDSKEAEKTYSKLLNRPIQVLSLSPRGDLLEAAQNLFSMMRELDHSDAELLIAEPPQSHEGLGHAILDRLTRASAKK